MDPGTNRNQIAEPVHFKFYIMENTSVSPGKGPGERWGWIGTCWPKLTKLMPVLGPGGLLYLTLPDSGVCHCHLRGQWFNSYLTCWQKKFASHFHPQANLTGCKQRRQVQFSHWQLFQSSKIFFCVWVNAFPTWGCLWFMWIMRQPSVKYWINLPYCQQVEL